METIVEYTARKKPFNAYPKRVISPFHHQSCCSARMVQIGTVRKDQRGFSFYYRRCQVCGFTLRHFLPIQPPEESPMVQRLRRFPRAVEQVA